MMLKKKMPHRTLVWTLALVLLLLLALALLAAPARANVTTHYGLWVGGLEVTSERLYHVGADADPYGTGRWDYDPDAYTLTLDAYVYSGEGHAFGYNNTHGAALYYDGTEPLTIELVGESRLTLDSGGTSPRYAYSYGMMYFARPGDTDNPKLTIRSASGGSLTARAGAGSSGSYGIYITRYDLLLADADVEAIGGNGKYNSIGLFALFSELEIGSGATLTTRGGKADVACSRGVDCQHSKLLVSGGTLDARGGQAGENYSTGIFSSSIDDTMPSVSVTAGVLIAEGKDKAFDLDEKASLFVADSMAVYAGSDAEHTTQISSNTGVGSEKYVKIYQPYNLWVGGLEVTSERPYYVGADADPYGTGKWTYDPSSYTLTLDTYVYSGEGYYFTDYDTDYGKVSCAAALFYEGTEPLTIEVTGACSLTQSPSPSRPLDESYGMLFYGDKAKDANVTIQSHADAGSLTLTAGKAKHYSEGIYIYGGILGGDLSVSNITLSAYSCTADYSYGLEADDLTITSGTVYAVAADAQAKSYGIECYDLTVSSGAHVVGTAGVAGKTSHGIDCSDLAVSSGAHVIGTASAAGYSSHGIDCYSATVSGAGTVVTGIGAETSASDPNDDEGVFGILAYSVVDASAIDDCLGVYDAEDAELWEPGAEYLARQKETYYQEDHARIPYARIAAREGIMAVFNANGGAFSDGRSTWKKKADTDATLGRMAQDVTPTRSGYTFSGWSLTSDGAKVADNYVILDNVTFYALWTAQGGSYYVGGGDSRPAAPKAADGTTNGKLTFDPANPKSGDTVTVTVTPDDGYELDSITAKDANGRDVTLTKNDDGTYSFTQGSSQVTVTATFKEKKTETLDPLAAFSDLDPKAWYADDVRWALTEGIMNGMGGGIFDPDGKVSRAMVMQVLWKMEGCPVVNYAMTFSDVDQEEWYAEAVRWAAATGLTEGYEDGTFRPDAPVTRQELATLLYRYVQGKGLGFTGAWYFPLEFSDAGDVDDWADEAVHWMVMNGILNGRGENLLVPGGTATRSELAAILHRLDALLAT